MPRAPRNAVEAKTETFDRTVLDLSACIKRWVELLASLAPDVKETLAFANNHYLGHAPDTLRALAKAFAARS